MLIFQRIVFSVFLFFHLFSVASQTQLVKPVIRIAYPTHPTIYTVEKHNSHLHSLDKYERIFKDSCYLRRLLIEKNVVAAIKFLDDENVSINPLWKNYSFGSKNTLTIVDLACKIGNICIIEKILKQSNTDCFIDIVESLSQQNSGYVLKLFLINHKERAFAEKFSIWRTAIEGKSLWKNIKQLTATKIVVFDNICTLLFPDNLNAVDENGDSLLHIAVYERNIEALKYLLSKNINMELLNKQGCGPVHYAVTDVNMLSCLYDNKANINLANRDGDTSLDFCYSIFFTSKITKEKEMIEASASFLLQKGVQARIENSRGIMLRNWLKANDK